MTHAVSKNYHCSLKINKAPLLFISTSLSSFHWLILGFLYASFLQWSKLPMVKPIASPTTPTFIILSAHTTINNDLSYLTLSFRDGVLLLYLPLKNMTVLKWTRGVGWKRKDVVFKWHHLICIQVISIILILCFTLTMCIWKHEYLKRDYGGSILKKRISNIAK